VTLERFGEARAAAELPQVFQASELVEPRAVVRLGEVVIDARGQGVVALRRADARDERREIGRGARRRL
jgi:hypothetical protein